MLNLQFAFQLDHYIICTSIDLNNTHIYSNYNVVCSVYINYHNICTSFPSTKYNIYTVYKTRKSENITSTSYVCVAQLQVRL